MTKLKTTLGFYIVLLIAQFGAQQANALPGDLAQEFSLSAHSFVADRNSNTVYVSDTGTNSVAILDMNHLTLVDTIFVGSDPRGMALSRDGSTLYVATAGASSIAVVDLQNRILLAPITLPTPVADVEVDYLGRIYAAPTSTNDRSLLVYDPTTGQVTEPFPNFCSVCYRPLLEMSADGRTLYAANRGLSPGTLAKYDVSGAVPQLLWQNAHGSLGSNGQDLWLVKNDAHVYYLVGGGNNVSSAYDIAQIDADSMLILGALNTGAYPRELVTSADGKTAYAVHTKGHIDVWNAQTFLKVTEYTTVGEAQELYVDHSGDYLLAAFAESLRIYEAEGSDPLVDEDLDGVDDLVDNCLGLFNPAQLDADRDGLGDLCDPFPNNPNNELAQCELDRDDALMQLGQCLSNPSFADADLDGEHDAGDRCANSLFGESVDDSGCSIEQFCAKQTRYWPCRKSDWNNDKPVGRVKDCKWKSGMCLPF